MIALLAALNLATLFILGLVGYVLAWAMLRHVVYWTGLGRSLFVFFATIGLGATHNLYWQLVVGQKAPIWADVLFRLPIVAGGIGILTFLWKYPWPLPAEGVRWMDLLGLNRDDG